MDSQLQENRELLNKIEFGLKLAIRRLYEKKAANNENAIVYMNGEVRHIPARELWKDYDKD
jgi:hypothetical protein